MSEGAEFIQETPEWIVNPIIETPKEFYEYYIQPEFWSPSDVKSIITIKSYDFNLLNIGFTLSQIAKEEGGGVILYNGLYDNSPYLYKKYYKEIVRIYLETTVLEYYEAAIMTANNCLNDMKDQIEVLI